MASSPIGTMMGGGAPQGGPGPAAPAPQGPAPAPASSAPASPEMMALAKLYQVITQMAQQNSVIAPGLSKAAEGIQEAQSALVTQPQPQPIGMTPPL